jgi:hypothetical protein
MKKGFSPTPKPEKKITNVKDELSRVTRRFKHLMKNPIITVATLDKPKPDPVE